MADQPLLHRAILARLGPHPLVVLDVGLAVCIGGGLISDTFFSEQATSVSVAGKVVRIVALVACFAAVPWRRRSPRRALAVAVAGASVADGLGAPTQAAITVALCAYTVATRAETTRRPLVLGTAAGAIGVGVILGHDPGRLGALVASIAVISVGWFAGEMVRSRRAYDRTIEERRAEQDRQREAQLRQAAADERLLIARELHDVVAHAMSLVAVRAGVARVVMDDDPHEVREALGIIETTSRRALQEMRLLVGVLRDGDDRAELAPAPGMADLPVLVEQVRQAGVEVQVSTTGEVRRLPAGVDLSAYRIVQEALTNVVRHAGPTAARLSIGYLPEELSLELTDAGPPHGAPAPVADARPGGGHGLVGMRERAALFGGQIVAGPSGRGYRIVARLPTDDVAV